MLHAQRSGDNTAHHRMGRGSAIHLGYTDHERAYTLCGRLDAQGPLAHQWLVRVGSDEAVTCKGCQKAAAGPEVATPPKRRKLEATLPDGHTATRTTARDYTAVIAAYSNGTWGALAWSKDADTANRRISGEFARFPADELRTVPVN